MNLDEQNYWTKRYDEARTGWDIGHISTPLKLYFNQLTNKDLKILIPGAGNAYEAEYLYNLGFKNIFIMDISEIPLNSFSVRNLSFPKDKLLHDDFFKHNSCYDLIIEQTFFCSFTPTKANRNAYAKKMHELLKPNGKLVGLWFDIPLTKDFEKRPFGGNKKLNLSYFRPYFKVLTFEKSYNSIPERLNKEIFGILTAK